MKVEVGRYLRRCLVSGAVKVETVGVTKENISVVSYVQHYDVSLPPPPL